MPSRLTVALLTTLLLTVSCAKKSNDSDSTGGDAADDQVSYAVEAALSDIADNTSSSNTSQIFQDQNIDPDDLHAQSECSYATARDTSLCSSSQTAIVTWGGCTKGTATITGTVTETYSGFGAAVCSLNGNNSTVHRLISSSAPRVVTKASGATVTETMSPSTAWDGTTFPSATSGTVITRSESGTSNGFTCAANNGCHHVVVNGIESIRKGPRGTTLSDHIVTSDFTYQGKKSSGNLVVSGTSTVWHQLASYKLVNTLNAVTWGDSTCCYPTSGTVTSAATGSLTGSATMTFTSTCGSASFVATTGETSTVTLSQCQP